MPPQAVISQHTTASEKQAGTVISLSATGSILETGGWHTHKFEWKVAHQALGATWTTLVVRDPRIGANVDAAQKFRGFNFEFLADKAGNYHIQLTVTDEAGQSDSDSITITIPASTRTNHYVDVNGSDTSGDGSLSRPWATVHKALTMLDDSSNWKMNLRAGQEQINGVPYDLEGWNGLPQVGLEHRTTTTLEANIRPTSPTVVPAVGGVFEDYYGNPRTQVWAGAVGPAPVPLP